MNKRQLLLAAGLAGVTGLTGVAAHAHGQAGHGGHGGHGAHGRTAAPARKEQKPWGVAGEPRAARRTLEVRMNDQMRFVPDRLQLREGETVRLVIHNDGRLVHEFVMGTKQELDEHAEMMKKHPGMEHDEPYMVHVDPGGRGEIVWHFNRAGEFDFGCLIAGHYDAGMVGRIQVAKR